MKQHALSLLLLVSGISLLNAVPYEYSERNGWHFILGGSTIIPASANFNSSASNGAAASGKLNYEVVASPILGVGYTRNHWRYELEYSFKKLDIDEINAKGIFTPNDDKHVSYHTMMLSASYDWYIRKKLYWYNGAGVGLGVAKYDNGSIGGDDNALVFAFQLTTGFAYEVMDNVDVFWGYKLFKATSMDFDYNDSTGVSHGTDIDSPWMSQFEAGLRIRI